MLCGGRTKRGNTSPFVVLKPRRHEGILKVRFSLRKMLLLVAVCCVAAFIGDYIRRAATYGVSDAYAEMTAVRLLIAYMNENDGAWPSDWQQLEAYYAWASWNPTMPFEEFQDRIWIDFQANADLMRKAAQSHERSDYNVVFAQQRTGFHFEPGPNQMIHDYLREKYKENTRPKSAE